MSSSLDSLYLWISLSLRPEALEKHKDNLGLVYHKILREGREIYAA